MLTAHDSMLWALDPVRFATEALGITPDAWQAKALRSQAPRQLWNVSRQAGKSTIAAVLALHTALYRPGSLTLLVSPSLRQSSELFRKVTDLLQRLPSPPALPEDNRLSLTLDSGSRVVSLPGSEATVRGFSAPALVIEDEASRVDDALYTAIRPMLAVSGGRLLLLSTPFGRRGHYWQAWSEGQGWERVQVTAAQCPRISAAFLEAERVALGPWAYSQEYECTFAATVDSYFRDEDIAAAFVDMPPLFDDEPAAAPEPELVDLPPLFGDDDATT